MALSAAASFSFSAPAPLFTLLFVFAPASSLPRAWASALAPAPPFSETCYISFMSPNYKKLFNVSSCSGRHVHLHERT